VVVVGGRGKAKHVDPATARDCKKCLGMPPCKALGRSIDRSMGLSSYIYKPRRRSIQSIRSPHHHFLCSLHQSNPIQSNRIQSKSVYMRGFYIKQTCSARGLVPSINHSINRSFWGPQRHTSRHQLLPSLPLPFDRFNQAACCSGLLTKSWMYLLRDGWFSCGLCVWGDWPSS
jgi:hypothetical protein